VKDPWAVALLQTAAFLAGGWSVLYAFRRWFAGRSKGYAGHFTYFDPLFVYVVDGERVRTIDLYGIQSVRALKINGGTVELNYGNDRVELIPVKSMVIAQEIEDYYSAIDDLERRDGSPWPEAEPAVLGAAARFATAEDRFPRDAGVLDLDFQSIPEEPKKANRAGVGLVALILIILAGGGLYAAFWQANKPLGDELAFERAKESGAPGLRGYLLDERNTRHRDEAKKLLAEKYDTPVNRLRTLAPGQNADLRNGMIRLVESLRTADAPVISFDVKQEDAAATADRSGKLREEVADALGRSIGTDLIAFAAPPEGTAAHLTIRYRRTPAADGQASVAQVTVEIRVHPKQEPVATGTFIVTDVGPEGTPPDVDKLKVDISRELVGEYRPAPPPGGFGGGDF
jgi:hypothetical protein